MRLTAHLPFRQQRQMCRAVPTIWQWGGLPYGLSCPAHRRAAGASGPTGGLTGEIIWARRRVSDRDQIAYEDEGLARRDHMPGAPVAVGQGRGDDQLAAAADLHALHALVPAGDDL